VLVQDGESVGLECAKVVFQKFEILHTLTLDYNLCLQLGLMAWSVIVLEK
jgi:hypothetical protein